MEDKEIRDILNRIEERECGRRTFGRLLSNMKKVEGGIESALYTRECIYIHIHARATTTTNQLTNGGPP